MIAIGKNIKRIRESMGLSQEAFGLLIGKSSSQVSSYEKGSEVLSSTIYKIAEVAGVDFNTVMGDEPEKREPEPKWDAELRIYNMDARLEVIRILAKNGYDVGQNKRPKGKGNAVDYFVHAKDLATNADTSK